MRRRRSRCGGRDTETECRDDRDVVAMRRRERETDTKSRCGDKIATRRKNCERCGDESASDAEIKPRVIQRRNCERRQNHEREPATQFPAWPRESAATPHICAPPPNSGCRHCARVGRGSQRDIGPEIQAEPTDELPPSSPRVGFLPNRASRDAGPALLHGAAEIGQNAYLSRPLPEQRGLPKHGGRGRNSAGSPLDVYQQQNRAPRPQSFTQGNGAPKRLPPINPRQEGNPWGARIHRPPLQLHPGATPSHRHQSPLPPRSTPLHPQHSDTDSSTTDRRYATYAQAVTRNLTGAATTEADGWTTVQRPQSAGRPPTHRRPVDLRQEGRCFRCLARGHVARSCREPIKCRVCRQGGHRQASCPFRRLR